MATLNETDDRKGHNAIPQAVMYVRVAREPERQPGVAVERQRATCEEWIDQHRSSLDIAEGYRATPLDFSNGEPGSGDPA
ncbi:hypothetical protein [Nocardia sp. alder85J]|uniref:hypothetical protein n=1 Tax=Nocardia sp. alder85J TaxID=2862949 RepID=UPI001CD1B505|nr:hypothetical protein [Nocardia sp. alder85J]MCX4098061.1 hypothetical protein [Nocardia sp. alder85J]